jgi:hypothetical protein
MCSDSWCFNGSSYDLRDNANPSDCTLVTDNGPGDVVTGHGTFTRPAKNVGIFVGGSDKHSRPVSYAVQTRGWHALMSGSNRHATSDNDNDNISFRATDRRL